MTFTYQLAPSGHTLLDLSNGGNRIWNVVRIIAVYEGKEGMRNRAEGEEINLLA